MARNAFGDTVRLRPREARRTFDPAQTRVDIFRGKFGRLLDIGQWWVALVDGACLGAVLLAVLGPGSTMTAVVLLAAWAVFVYWTDRHVERWTEEHNARLAG